MEVRDLVKAYGDRRAVDGVSFAVPPGQTLVLLGPSGCGKTTTLKMLNRLVEPTGGEIRVGGRNVRTLPPAELRRGIGYVIQETGLFPHYTVAENVGVVPRLLGWEVARIRARVDELLDLMGLPAALADRAPATLSGGQQQRVGIARALAADPPVLLLDEPFGALDPITRQQLQREFRRLGPLRDKAKVLVTHDVAEAVTLGDTICLLKEGRTQQIGPPADLVFRPANHFVRTFFAADRLPLELRVARLADVLPHAAGEESTPGVPTVDPYVSLLEAMERPHVDVASGGGVRRYGREALLVGFYTWRERAAGGE